jgi:hypothetical protein
MKDFLYWIFQYHVNLSNNSVYNHTNCYIKIFTTYEKCFAFLFFLTTGNESCDAVIWFPLMFEVLGSKPDLGILVKWVCVCAFVFKVIRLDIGKKTMGQYRKNII